MSQFITHKGFTYELIENHGFYHCLVYDKGQKKVLYRTRYFGSEERARSKTLLFIQDYIAHEEAKLRKVRAEARRKAEKEIKKEEKKVLARSLRPKREKRKKGVQASEPKLTEPISTSLYTPSRPLHQQFILPMKRLEAKKM